VSTATIGAAAAAAEVTERRAWARASSADTEQRARSVRADAWSGAPAGGPAARRVGSARRCSCCLRWRPAWPSCTWTCAATAGRTLGRRRPGAGHISPRRRSATASTVPPEASSGPGSSRLPDDVARTAAERPTARNAGTSPCTLRWPPCGTISARGRNPRRQRHVFRRGESELQ
jgi:hypothetical protein